MELARRKLVSRQRAALLRHSQQATRTAARLERGVDLHTAGVFERAPLSRRARRDARGEDPVEELPVVRLGSYEKPGGGNKEAEANKR